MVGAVLGTSIVLPSSARAVETAPLVVIVMENQSFSSGDGDPVNYVIGNPNAPYINGTLVPGGTLFTRYYAGRHPSLPNYLEMTAGTNGGCTNNKCPPDSISSDNIFHQLGEAGSSFYTFAQSMPSACSLTSKSPFSVHHDPEAYFTNVDAMSGVPYACPVTNVPLPATLPDPLPNFSFVVPDNCHNMHGTTAKGTCPSGTDQIIAEGDAWLSQAVPTLLAAGATVIVTFDEASDLDATNGGGHVVTVMVGANVVAGVTDPTVYSHLSLLAGIEDYFGLPYLAAAATALPLPIPTGPPPSAPVVDSFDPLSGASQDEVTITGVNLTGTTAVRFAGTAASFMVIDDTSISAAVPAGAVTGPITVTSRGGTGTSSSDFMITRPTLSGVSLTTGKAAASASSFTSSSISPSTSVLFVWVLDTAKVAPPATLTAIAGLCASWSSVTQIVSSDGHRRLSLWDGTGCSGSGRVSGSFSTGVQAARYAVEEFRGGIDPSVPVETTNVIAAGPAGAASSIAVMPNQLQANGDAFYVGVSHPIAEDVTPLGTSSEIVDTNATSSAGIETNAMPAWTSGPMGGAWSTRSRRAVIIGVEVRAEADATRV